MRRRIVAGVREGVAVFLEDERVESQQVRSVPGLEFAEMWTATAVPPHPPATSHVPSRGYLPTVGATQFQIVTFPPDTVFASPDFDPAAAHAEQIALMPGVAGHYDPDHPGMHATPSLDYVIVIDGSIVLELDNGVTKTLETGDVVIQCGARHAWHNPGSKPATIAVVLIGDASAVSPPIHDGGI